MRRMLLAIRDQDCGAALERHLSTLVAAEGLQVVVLNVQPSPIRWQTRGLCQEAIEAYLLARGHAACQSMTGWLRARAIPHRVEVRLGDACRQIICCAAEAGCSEIAIRAEPLGRLARCALRMTGYVGSDAAQIIHRSQVPVSVLH